MCLGAKVCSQLESLFTKFLSASLDLKTVCKELTTVEYRWYDIGIQLGVPIHKLKLFETQRGLSEIVDYWLRGNIEDASISWDFIATTLKSVDESGLAKEICKKYCQSNKCLGK